MEGANHVEVSRQLKNSGDIGQVIFLSNNYGGTRTLIVCAGQEACLSLDKV